MLKVSGRIIRPPCFRMLSMSKKPAHILRFLILFLLSCAAAVAGSALFADQVLVIKSERKMYLLQNGVIFKEYDIMLGLNPLGHKQEKGDNRTPEGRYVLQGRNPQSRFHRSIHISYPNEEDRKGAEERGVDPGSHIAIHGLPEKSEESAWDFIERDWTNGCIAVTNPEIEEIWELVKDGTPIEIRP